jgi:hypothetical protein
VRNAPEASAFPLISRNGCALMLLGLGDYTMRILGIVALCAALGGCVTAETVSFRASNPQQQAMMRDGQPALVSRQKSSLVLVRPAARQLQANGVMLTEFTHKLPPCSASHSS